MHTIKAHIFDTEEVVVNGVNVVEGKVRLLNGDITSEAMRQFAIKEMHGALFYVSTEKPRKPKRHKKAKISGTKVVKVITDDIAAGEKRIGASLEGKSEDEIKRLRHIQKQADMLCDRHRYSVEQEGRIINMAIESGLATLCTGTGAVFPAMRDDVDIRAEVLEFARQVKAMVVSEACFNEMLKNWSPVDESGNMQEKQVDKNEKKQGFVDSVPLPNLDLLPCPFCGGRASILTYSNSTAEIVECRSCLAKITGYRPLEVLESWNKRTPDPDFQEVKPSREALIDKFDKTHWVDNVGQGVSWRERELMKKAVLWAHGFKE